MTVALCGTCMHVHRASARWARAPAPVPARVTAGSWLALVAPLMVACDGCGREPISPRFPHAVFVADKTDLAAKESA